MAFSSARMVQSEMSPPPPEKSLKIGFLSNIGPYHLKYHKATKPSFDDGPLIVVCGSSLPSPTKKSVAKVAPTPTKLSGSAHAIYDAPSKRHITLKATQQQGHNQNKATSPFFLSVMIAKLDGALSTVLSVLNHMRKITFISISLVQHP